MLIVQVCDFGNDGDAEYRMHAPLRQLGKIPGLMTIDCHFSHRSLPLLAEIADVLILQFVHDWGLLSLCQRRREAGKITIFEANDDFFDLQPWSPIAEAWLDRSVQALYLKWLTTANGVQTSTNALADRWRQSGARNVAVFRNHLVDLDPLPAIPDRPLTIGWGGSPGHFADWYQLAPLLTNWLAAHPDVHLSVMTHELAHPFIRLEPHRYRFTHFGSLEDYVRFLHSLDIGLAPLLSTGYNRGRSDVKFLEYASQGVAGIYADLAPYQSSVKHGETGLLCKDAAGMVAELDRLAQETELRHQIRQRAHAYVAENRRLPENVMERVRWYQSLLPHHIAENVILPLSVQQAISSQDGNYISLRPGEPERLLLASMSPSTAAEALRQLSPLTQQTPDYIAALARQGQLLNDTREHLRAHQVLEQARLLAPKCPRVLSELGRCWFCLNNPLQARQLLEAAIQADENYLPAWQYLLRLIRLNRMADGAEWANRAEMQFPQCYSLAILAAQIHPLPESLRALSRMVDRIAPSIVPRERATVLRAIRQELSGILSSASGSPEWMHLLEKMCEFFPESAWLANELGAELQRVGRGSEAHRWHSHAFQLRQQALIYRDEFPKQEAAPWAWQFSDHIHTHSTPE